MTDLSRKGDRDSAAAATNVDNPLAGPDIGAIDQDIGDRRQQDVLHLLPIGPALTARPVPIGDLIDVLIVTEWRFHRLSRPYFVFLLAASSMLPPFVRHLLK
jgi:hypothetical protein